MATLNSAHAFSDDHDSSQDGMDYVYQDGESQATKTSSTEEYHHPEDPSIIADAQDQTTSMDADDSDHSNNEEDAIVKESSESNNPLYDNEGYLLWARLYGIENDNPEEKMINWLKTALEEDDMEQLELMLRSFNELDEFDYNFFHTIIFRGHLRLLEFIFDNINQLYTKNPYINCTKLFTQGLTTLTHRCDLVYPSWSTFQLALLADDLELFVKLIDIADRCELRICYEVSKFQDKVDFIEALLKKPLGHLRTLIVLQSFYGNQELPYDIDADFAKNILKDLLNLFKNHQDDVKFLNFLQAIALGFFFRTDCFGILESFMIEEAAKADADLDVILSFIQWLSNSKSLTQKSNSMFLLMPCSKLLTTIYNIDTYFAIFNCRYLSQRLLPIYANAFASIKSSCGRPTVDEVFAQIQKSKRLSLSSNTRSSCNWVDFDKDYALFLEQNEESFLQILNELNLKSTENQCIHPILNNKSKFYAFFIYIYLKNFNNYAFWANHKNLELFLCMWLESIWGLEDATLLNFSTTSGDGGDAPSGSGARIISIYDGLPTPTSNFDNRERLLNAVGWAIISSASNSL